MGIKNIHIALIGCSVLISGVFGIWGLKHEYAELGGISLIAAVGLAIYGINFLKKAKAL